MTMSKQRFANLLVATDGSPSSRSAVELAAASGGLGHGPARRRSG
jgi:hypothetical protein